MLMRKMLIFLMVSGIALGACGRKEMPQVDVDTGKPPHIEGLTHEMAGNSLRVSFAILGGSGPVGYQVDRAEIDPHCNCAAFWQRFFEQPAIRGQKGKVLSHTLNLRNYKREFSFRIRPVDSYGNLGAWSPPIRARAEKLE